LRVYTFFFLSFSTERKGGREKRKGEKKISSNCATLHLAPLSSVTGIGGGKKEGEDQETLLTHYSTPTTKGKKKRKSGLFPEAHTSIESSLSTIPDAETKGRREGGKEGRGGLPGQHSSNLSFTRSARQKKKGGGKKRSTFQNHVQGHLSHLVDWGKREEKKRNLSETKILTPHYVPSNRHVMNKPQKKGSGRGRKEKKAEDPTRVLYQSSPTPASLR